MENTDAGGDTCDGSGFHASARRHRRLGRSARSLPRLASGLLLSALSLVAAALAAEPVARPQGSTSGNDPVGASAEGSSALAASPATSLLSAPADGASLHGAGARFAWMRSAGLRYRLQVARDDAFTDLAVDLAGLDSDEAIVALPPGEYRWRIASMEPAAGATAGAGPYSEVRRFTLRPMPSSPPIEPPQVRDGTLTLRWRADQPGETFEAQLARDPMFADIVARYAGPDPQMTLPDPAAGVFYLRVRTIDATGYVGPYGPAHAIDVPRSRWWQLLPPLSVLWWLLL